ncbi:MAG TPA: hypothetical protein VGK48_05515 [Terriglobia bacterium]|jgi:hypothetical protein
MRIRFPFALLSIIAALVFSSTALRAADTLPNQLPDDAFWKLIDSSSEDGGAFQSENFLSNETGFQAVIPTLQQTTKPGGVYMGVGPEQNFTYIAGIRPKMAFIVDIRHQNMLEHMLYRAVFELSPNRADFLARLFSVKRPAGLTEKSTVDDLFNAFAAAEPLDNAAFQKNLQDIKDLLLTKHKFGLTPEDQDGIAHVYTVFHSFGPEMDYNSGGSLRGRGRGGMPNYTELMVATDLKGEKRSYLANEEHYRFLRDLEMKNLIVPLTGDFGGPKAIRSVGKYLKDHNATVTAFYLSNVEQYLFQGNGNENGGWTNFYNNAATLPLDASSTFIRSAGGGVRGFAGGGMRAPNVLASMQETLAAVKSGQIRSYIDLFAL